MAEVGAWNSDAWEEFVDGVASENEGGEHGPYYVISPLGKVYEIHRWHVARDHNSSYPVLENEWAHMAEHGRHAFFHAAALFTKPSRKLMAKTIVVLRQFDGNYVWCVRFHTLTPSGERVGRNFLWPLQSAQACRFYEELARDPNPAVQHSSLVQELIPMRAEELFPTSFPGARPVSRLASASDCLFVASLNVVTHDPTQQISRLWSDRVMLRGGWNRPLRISHAPKRRSPRKATGSLVEVLPQEVIDDIVMTRLEDCFLSAKYTDLYTVLEMRLVCRAFNAGVLCGMRIAADIVLDKVADLEANPDLPTVYQTRAQLTHAGINLFRAMAECASLQECTLHPLCERYLRLAFNKKPDDRPPMGTTWVMKRVLGESQRMLDVHASSRHSLVSVPRHGHETRRAKQTAVRFKLAVPDERVSDMRIKGWYVAAVQPEVPHCGQCVFRDRR